MKIKNMTVYCLEYMSGGDRVEEHLPTRKLADARFNELKGGQGAVDGELELVRLDILPPTKANICQFLNGYGYVLKRTLLAKWERPEGANDED